MGERKLCKTCIVEKCSCISDMVVDCNDYKPHDSQIILSYDKIVNNLYDEETKLFKIVLEFYDCNNNKYRKSYKIKIVDKNINVTDKLKNEILLGVKSFLDTLKPMKNETLNYNFDKIHTIDLKLAGITII